MTKNTKGWTEERRKAQAERIRQNKPWEKSTGPKSKAGKARSSMNAFKHGMDRVELKIVKEMLDVQYEFTTLFTIYARNKLKRRNNPTRNEES